MGRADVRAGSHGRDLGRHRNEHAGGGGPAAGRGYKDHDGEGRADEVLDDEAHRGVEAAGRIQLDDQRLRPVGLRESEGVVQILGRHRIDDPFIDRHDDR